MGILSPVFKGNCSPTGPQNHYFQVSRSTRHNTRNTSNTLQLAIGKSREDKGTATTLLLQQQEMKREAGSFLKQSHSMQTPALSHDLGNTSAILQSVFQKQGV